MAKWTYWIVFAGLFSLHSGAQVLTDQSGNTVALGGYSGGGHDDRVAEFYRAKANLVADLKRLVERTQKLNELAPEVISAEEKEVLNRYLHVILDEAKSIEFDFDHTTTRTFENADRSHSWIRTNPEPFGVIGVRTIPMGAKKSVDSLKSRLLHECIHHIPEIGLDEQKAFSVGSVFLKAFTVVKQTYKFPELADWPQWMVSVAGDKGKKEGCGFYIQVLANPEAGTMSVTSARNSKGGQGASGFLPGLFEFLSLGVIDVTCLSSREFSILFHCTRDSGAIECSPNYCYTNSDPKCGDPNADKSKHPRNSSWLRLFPESQGLKLYNNEGGFTSDYLPLDLSKMKTDDSKVLRTTPR